MTTTALWMTSCLLGGFAIGAKVHNPLKTTTLHFEKLAWVPGASSLQLAKLDANELEQKQLKISVNFEPFELPARPAAGLQKTKKLRPHKDNAWAKLEQAVKKLKFTSLARQQREPGILNENFFADYRDASRELRRDFTLALAPTQQSVENPVITAQGTGASEIKTIDSSAELDQAPILLSEGSEAPNRSAKAVDTHPVTTHQNFNQADANSNLRISQRQARPRPRAKAVAPVTVSVAIKSKPAAMKASNSDEPTEQEVAKLVAEQALTGRDSTARIPDDATESVHPSVLAQQNTAQTAEKQNDEGKAYFDSSLTAEQKRVLAEALLNEQAKTMSGQLISQKPNGNAIAGTPKGTNPSQPVAQTEVKAPDDDRIIDKTGGNRIPDVSKAGDCAVLKYTKFIGPLGNQVCPSGQQWISKSWNGSGWVKAESEGSLPTLSYYPSPNSGSALLLEQASVAFLGIKTGSRVMKGMGVIVGTLPEGYQVEFAGRAEEPESFLVQGKKYFAIINAEPGAGVVQLTGKKQDDAVTVFAPVLEDTVTYLDLVAPTPADFVVKVVKNGSAQDPEVVGLTVGISTEGKIRGITQTNGRAYLRQVPIVPGYPVFIDVSSKSQNEKGYQYRYLLQNRNRAGEYVVNQIAEPTLFHWIKQVRQGLSDQSAMLVGFYDRSRVGGFKEHYFAKAEPKTAKFGLEPLNYSILWDGRISANEPLEGDIPRFMSVQVPEGLTEVRLSTEAGQVIESELIPVSPRVIHVISQ